MGSLWTDEKDAVIRRMVDEGKTFGQVALKLDMSRSAVIGRAHRLGIKSKNPAHPVASTEPKPPRVYKPRPKAERLPSPKLTREEAVLRCAAVEPMHVGLIDLEHHHCRYPYGDAVPFTFCGHPKIDGWAYCAAHAAICVNDVKAERRKAA